MTNWWERRWFAALMIVAATLPLWWPPLPPLLDLPPAMARGHVMLGSDAAVLGQWYRYEPRLVGYLGVDLIAALLGPLIGLAATFKLIALGIPALTVAGMLAISRAAHGRVEPLALLALPLAYNFAFVWGFLNFTLGMALAFNAFALWLALARRARLRAGVFVVVAWLVWITHLFGWITLGVLVFGAETGARRAVGKRWIAALWEAGLACLPLAPPAVMALAWRPSAGNVPGDYLDSLPRKPAWLAMVLRDRWRAFDVAATAAIAVLLYRAVRSRDFKASPALAGAAIAMLFLFLLLPFGYAYIDARVAPYVLMIALLAFASAATASRRSVAVLAAIGLALFGVRLAGVGASLAIESRDWQRHLAALDHVPRGSRIAAFVVNACPPGWNANRLNHLPSLAVVRRAAFANDQFAFAGGTGLLHVVTPGLGDYALDPSQSVTEHDCAAAGPIRPLAERLQGFPRARFDLVWLIGLSRPPEPALLRGLTPIWRNRTDMLLRIDRGGLSERGARH